MLNIVGEPVGGVRRHVHTILACLSDEEFESSYAHSVVSTDSSFAEDLRILRPRLKGLLPLQIRKKPGLDDISTLWVLLQYVRKHRVHIVHGHGAKGGAYARLLKLFADVATIYTPHGGVLHDAFSSIERFFYLAIERQLMRLTDALVFESDYASGIYLTKIGKPGCPVVVNYNGVSPHSVRRTGLIPRQLKGDRQPGFHIGVFARLHPLKGQALAIEAIERLRSESHPVVPGAIIYLHLFGSGPDEINLCAMVAKRKLGECVLFHGEINNPEEVMSYLDAVLIPSRFESLPYVAIEALMVGIPVVATNVGGLREVLDCGCGILVDAVHPDALAEGIKLLMENSGLGQQLVERGRLRYHAHFREDRMVSTLTDLYRRLKANPGI